MRLKRRLFRREYRCFRRIVSQYGLGKVASQSDKQATQETQGQFSLNLYKSDATNKQYQKNRRKLRMLQQLPAGEHPLVDSLTGKLPYSQKFRIATSNVQGLKITDRENLQQVMLSNHLDILCIQETHINHSSIEVHNGFCFIFSSGQCDPLAANAPREFAGVGFIVSPHMTTYLLHIETSHSRIARITLKNHGNPIHILSVYAPHAGRPQAEKHSFYHDLTECLTNIADSEIKLIFGDFNARIHHVFEEDRPNIGSHILGRGLQFLNQATDDTILNRELFLEFIKSNNFFAMNTHFLKAPEALCTYSEVSNTTGGPPWNALRYAQLDYVLVSARWKNIIHNVESMPSIQIDSDHFVLKSEIMIKLKADPRKQRPLRPKFRPFTAEQVSMFNNMVAARCTTPLPSGSATEWLRNFTRELHICAKHCFMTFPAHQKKSYISQETWDLIQLKHHYRRTHQKQAELELRRLVRKLARRDKQQQLLDTLENAYTVDERWKSISFARHRFVPRFIAFKDRYGNKIGPDQKAEATADFLTHVQWAPAPDSPPKIHPRQIIQEDLQLNHSDFSLEEIKIVIKSLKQKKAPGPDMLTNELLKALDDNNLVPILHLMNHCWNNATIPDDFEVASITSIFKKGNPQLLENYRPIALLNVLYKVYAALILNRLRPKIDKFIWKTQFGFRKARSTQQALYLARRTQDIAEMSGDNLILTLLDFEKAFDKVDQSRLLEALRRLNIHGKTLNAIRSMYQHPQFFVRDGGSISQTYEQFSGIRQGCPLSPFLFILLMTTLFSDVYDRVGANLLWYRPQHTCFNEVLFADDTLLLTSTTRSMNLFLKCVEEEASYYNLRFNHSKCQYLCMNRENNIHFRNGQALDKVTQSKYLGCLLSKTASTSVEISRRISSAMDALNSLKTFWNSSCHKRWKLGVYDAVVCSRLLYGLESLHLNKSHLNRLNAFQQRGLRRILGVPSSYIDRTFTNAKVFEMVSEYRRTPQLSVADLYYRQQLKFVGHLLRCDGNDPMRRLIVTPQNEIAAPLYRRPGRPRNSWSFHALQRAWVKFNDEVFTATPAQIQALYARAVARDF